MSRSQACPVSLRATRKPQNLPLPVLTGADGQKHGRRPDRPLPPDLQVQGHPSTRKE